MMVVNEGFSPTCPPLFLLHWPSFSEKVIKHDSVAERCIQTKRNSLFKQEPCHPCCFIWLVIKSTHSWASSTKAAWLLWLPNEEKAPFLWTICITGKAKCNTKLACSFPTHLLLCKSMTRWRKCEECWFIHIPAILRPELDQNLFDTHLFLFCILNIYRLLKYIKWLDQDLNLGPP